MIENNTLVKEDTLDAFIAGGAADEQGSWITDKYKRGDVLFWEDDRPKNLYRVEDGWVKMVKHGSSGKDTIVALYGPGEVIGEIHLLSDEPYNATAIVMAPAVISRQPLDAVYSQLEDHPQFLRTLAVKLSNRLRDTQEVVQGMATERVEKRIANLLVKLGGRQNCGAACTLEIPLTRQEVADMVGATIETTIRIFSRFIEDGAIRRGGRKLAISDLDYLREIANWDE